MSRFVGVQALRPIIEKQIKFGIMVRRRNNFQFLRGDPMIDIILSTLCNGRSKWLSIPLYFPFPAVLPSTAKAQPCTAHQSPTSLPNSCLVL